MDSFTFNAGESFLATRDHLRKHPRNMRRYYKQADLFTMATSLSAHASNNASGNLHNLKVVPVDGIESLTFRRERDTGRVFLVDGICYVVDGNLRYESGSILKAQCPPYKCELVIAEQAEQLLTMTLSNTLRFDPDPISEALHYQRLKDEEGLLPRDIAALTGVNEKRVYSRLSLLELDEPIQALIAEDKLSHSEKVCAAFLSIPDARARVKLAERMATEGATANAIVEACASLNRGLQERTRGHAREAHPIPMVGRGEQGAGQRIANDEEPVPWKTVREAAAVMCSKCEVKQRQLEDVGEPAWHLVSHAADKTCANCNVRDLPGACKSCPGVEFMKRLILEVRVGHDADRKVPA